MDKREFSIKAEQMQKQAELGDYATAMKIADKIDWRRVTNVSQLARVSEIYEKNGEYREAKEIMLLAFERAPMGRGLLVKLLELALKDNDIAEAERYYREFLDLAPEDPRQYVLRYQILSAKGAAPAQKIPPLERYVELELDEPLMYELAELYHAAGRHEECVELCDRITLLFGTGEWVEKAMLLKTEREEQPLTEYQQNLLDHREEYTARLRALEERSELATEPLAQSEVEVQHEIPEPQEGMEELQADTEYVANAVPEPEAFSAEQSKAAAERAARVQREIDAEIEAHLSQLEAEENAVREAEERDQRQTIAALAAVSASQRRREEQQSEEERLAEVERKLAAAAEAEAAEQKKAEAEAAEQKQVETEAAAEISSAAEAVEQPAKEEHAATADSEKPSVVDDITRVLPKLPKTENAAAEKEAQEALEATRILPDLKQRNTGEAAEEQPVPEPAEKMEEEKAVAESADEAAEPADSLHLHYSCLIQGRTEEEGLAAAIQKLKEIHEESGVRNPAAKIRAEKLSLRGVKASAERIAGKDLIIECAGDLSEACVAELLELLMAEDGTRSVLLVDNPLQLTRLVAKYPQLKTVFRVESGLCHGDVTVQPAERKRAETELSGAAAGRSVPEEKSEETVVQSAPEEQPAKSTEAVRPAEIHTAAERSYEEEALDIDAFAHYASDYAKKIDCVITGKSMLALYERIEIMQEDGIGLTRKNAEALIEEVADRAEKPPLLKRIGGLFSPKYDKDGMLILKEDDFIS